MAYGLISYAAWKPGVDDFFQATEIMRHAGGRRDDVAIFGPPLVPGASFKGIVALLAEAGGKLPVVLQGSAEVAIGGEVTHLVRVLTMVEEEFLPVAAIGGVGELVIACCAPLGAVCPGRGGSHAL